jgi:broad specificity phosphatase PhoE
LSPTLVYMVRHGQTQWNVDDRFRGRADIPLNEKGCRDAEEAAFNLSGAGLVAVYTSPLSRARYVANRIAARTGIEAIHDHPGLINLEYGDWEGLTKQECAERDPSAWEAYAHRPEESLIPGGEALTDGITRVVQALREMGHRHPGRAVAAVSHGAIVRLAVVGVDGNYSNSSWQFKFPTGSAVVFSVHGEAIDVVRMPEITGDKTDEVRESVGDMH